MAAAARAPARSGSGSGCCRTCRRRACCAQDDGTFRLERPEERPSSIGRLRSFAGQHRGPRARVCLHPGPRRQRPARGQRRRRARGQLPASRASRIPSTSVRPAVQARIRRVGRRHQGADRGSHARYREAAHRLRLPSADHLLPVDRRGRDAHRADRDRIGRDARRLRRGAHRHRRGSRDAIPTSSRPPRTPRRSSGWTRRRRPASPTCAGARWPASRCPAPTEPAADPPPAPTTHEMNLFLALAVWFWY